MSKDDKYIISEFYEFSADRNLIIEAEKSNSPIIMSGILQKANTLNRNGRVYPYEILKREAANYMKIVEENRALGELDHPDSAIVSLANVSHKVIDMWWQGEELYGKVRITNTPPGNILKGLLESEVMLGISSRGVGSVKTSKGQDIVQDDFELIAFDFVSSPSTPGAFLFKEGVEKKFGMIPITEEQYKRIKCENGVCRIVNENENGEKNYIYRQLYNKLNNNFWKNI